MPKKYRFDDAFAQCPLHCQDPVAYNEPLELDPRGLLFAQMAQMLTQFFLFLSNGRSTEGGLRARSQEFERG